MSAENRRRRERIQNKPEPQAAVPPQPERRNVQQSTVTPRVPTMNTSSGQHQPNRVPDHPQRPNKVESPQYKVTTPPATPDGPPSEAVAAVETKDAPATSTGKCTKCGASSMPAHELCQTCLKLGAVGTVNA